MEGLHIDRRNKIHQYHKKQRISHWNLTAKNTFSQMSPTKAPPFKSQKLKIRHCNLTAKNPFSQISRILFLFFSASEKAKPKISNLPIMKYHSIFNDTQTLQFLYDELIKDTLHFYSKKTINYNFEDFLQDLHNVESSIVKNEILKIFKNRSILNFNSIIPNQAIDFGLWIYINSLKS